MSECDPQKAQETPAEGICEASVHGYAGGLMCQHGIPTAQAFTKKLFNMACQ